MSENMENYKKLMTDVIQKQIVILGPDIAIMKAKNVSTLTIADDGAVIEIKEDPQRALQQLIDEYVTLSGLIVKKTMEPLLQKYPSLKVNSHA